MNYKKNIYFISIMLFAFSCRLSKNQLKTKGSRDDARMNIILNILNTEKTHTTKTFYDIINPAIIDYPQVIDLNNIKIIDSLDELKNTYVFCIDKSQTKFIPSKKIILDTYTVSFPTNYYEKDNKLFLWYDRNKKLREEIIRKMQEYNCIDSLYYEDRDEREIIINPDDFQKNIFYFVCKKNISIFKKRKAIWIKPKNYPSIKCLN